MYANITVTLRHETGRTETIPNVHSAQHTDESTIEVSYYLPEIGTTVTDEYGALEWDIDGVSHTEIPPQERY